MVVEPGHLIDVGARPAGPSRVSDLERALLDAAARSGLVGGAVVVAEALATAAPETDPDRLMSYAELLGWNAALRRIGSIADRLGIEGLAGRLSPVRPPTADLDLEPPAHSATRWRDSRWWVRWGIDPDELLAAIR